jgi:hypothetical protein
LQERHKTPRRGKNYRSSIKEAEHVVKKGQKTNNNQRGQKCKQFTRGTCRVTRINGQIIGRND